MMYGEEKSDSLIVAAKQANNPKGAESVERRSGAKGNAEQPHCMGPPHIAIFTLT